MKKYLILGLTLLLVMAAAFSMGCTETGSDGSADEGSGDEEVNGVQGMIIFDEPVESFSNATIYLKVNDVSLQDAPSVVMSEDTIDDVSMDANDIQPVPYMIYYPDLEERMTYSLSVHVDVDGDGNLSNGDYYTTTSHAVPTEQGVHELDVHVNMI